MGAAPTRRSPRSIELRDQGVVGAIGAGMNQSAMLAGSSGETDVDVMMLAGRYTLLEQGALDDLLPAALERGVGVVAAGVYNSGPARRAAAGRRRPLRLRRPPRELGRAKATRGGVRAARGDAAGAAIAFPLRHPPVVSVVVGVRERRVRCRGSVDARSTRPVPDDLWRDLARRGPASTRGSAQVPPTDPPRQETAVTRHHLRRRRRRALSRPRSSLDGSDAMNKDARLLGRLRHPAHRRARARRATGSPSPSAAATTSARSRHVSAPNR